MGRHPMATMAVSLEPFYRAIAETHGAFAEGDDADGIFIVVSGIFQVYARSIGDRAMLADIILR